MGGSSMKYLHFIRMFGIFAFIEEFLERRKLWDLQKHDSLVSADSSSFSDTREYVSIVSMAADNQETFSRFRSNRQYRKILEHVTKDLGYKYLSEIKDLEKEYANLFSKVKYVDLVGGPLRYRFKQLGKLSPTTIRYMHVHLQLRKLFGSLEGYRVIEIGGGFGGQAALSTSLETNLLWLIYDLPSAIKLQQRVTDNLGLSTKISFSSGLDLVPNSGDLLISNYALSEISRNLQLEYIRLVIQNCPKGYMTWNLISERNGDGLSVTEVLGLIPNSIVYDEFPLTDEGNKIIIWGCNS
jgi:hypothetical protein